jgi:hypothetical protein
MKFSLIFAILAILLVTASAIKKAPKCNPLTLRCRCSNVKQIVCGESGKTHTNPCVANCFNDKVKHVGACTNQCKSTKQRCHYQPFGPKGGRRLKCCDDLKVCFGKSCSKSEENCKWKGPVIIKKRKGHCYWKKKNANKFQRICCKWSKICKGSCFKGTRRCYTTLKKCKWTGRVINTKRNRKCSFINLENGKRRRCCVFTKKCINFDKLTCKSKRRPKCWASRKCKYVGPYIKKKCKRSCQNLPVGKFGRRRRCCHSCRTCRTFKFTETPNKAKDVCVKKLNKCYWKGKIVVIRHHKKCAVKPYGRNKDRKRCCSWSVKCVGRHCKVIRRRCRWVGCVIVTHRRKLCRFRMKNDHQKQKFCCSFNRKCCSSKCVNYNQKCKWIGKIITTRHHWKCQMKRVKNGRKRRCCRIIKKCFGKKCTSKLGKCVWKGCLKSSKIVRKCSLKSLTKNVKCKFCCTSVRKCDCGLCRNVNTKCKCTKKYSYIHFTKCKKVTKRKGVKQQRCCRYKRVCRNKKCRVLKSKKCKWTGFEEIVEKKHFCRLRKTSKFGKKRFCCSWIRKCFGLKCKNSKKKCKFVGLEIIKRHIYKCSIRMYKKENASRKKCCAYIKSCIGTRCRNFNKKCKWVGQIYRRRKWVRKSWIKIRKFCRRRQICVFKQHCFGSKCRKISKKCRLTGKTQCRYRRVIKSWSRTRKGCALRKLCVVKSICVDNNCRSSPPQCRKVGKEVCHKNGKFCKWSLFNGKCHKKRCCQYKSKCIGTKCSRKLFNCSWKGKLRCRTFSFKCKLAKYKKSLRKMKCCKIQRTCVGKKCKSRISWCRWKGSLHRFKIHKKCQMLPIKKHKFIMIKRKRCSIWRKHCVGRKCKIIKIKHFWEGKKIIITRYRKCSVKHLNRKFNRKHCCRFTRICQGKKCRELKRGCFWYGKKIPREVNAFLRWKVVCRDIPFGKRKDIRLNCCKMLQRCIKDGPQYRCENIKRLKCWWRGSVRGDVWIQDQNGEWQEVNCIGSFRYLDDKESGIKIDTQFTQVGSGSVTSSIVLRARGKIIKANKDGSVFINGKKINRSGPIIIRFIKNHVIVKQLKKGDNNLTIVRGLTEDRLGFVYDIKSKSYELTVATQELSQGLFVDPENPRKYQLKKSDSRFDNYIKFKHLPDTNGTPTERRAAMQCCHLLDSDAKVNECVSDFIRTGRCFVEEYTKENPNLTFFKK